MCTASWLRAGEEFHFLFNRDELRNRARALPPRPAVAGETRYLAPIDGAAQGTWIALSERALLLALLNRTEEGLHPGAGAVSRGAIIPALVESPDLAAVASTLAALDLARTAPFRLFARAADGATAVWGWNGRQLDRGELDPQTGLLCSSGLGDARVDAVRRPLWERLRDAPGGLSLDALRAFHRSHLPAPSAESVCMHRDDAQTVSHCEVRISPGDLSVAYVDGPPAESGAPAVSRLERAS